MKSMCTHIGGWGKLSSQHLTKEIIVVTVEIGDGGAERVLTELMEQWVKKGNHVTLVQTRPNLYGRGYKLAKGIRRVDIDSNGRTKISRYTVETLSLIRYLKKHSDAVVVAFANASIRIVAVASLLVNNRIVFSERCDPRYTPDSQIMRWLRDRLFCVADICVFQTVQAKKLFPKRVQEKGVVIPNPVNNHLPDVKNRIRKKVIVTACRLAPQKNLPLLINAFAKLIMDFPEYKLEIYGTGVEEDRLQKLIIQLGLNNKAFLMGHSSNIYEIMRDCALYVCSSDYEGLSNSLIEALCMGAPVVSTDHPIGGAREMITNHENGILTPVGDTDALYKAMKYILSHPLEAKRMGDNAFLLRNRWPVDEIADRWLDLF